MSYAQTANRVNPAAMLGAVGMPGAFAVLLITGLAVTHEVIDAAEEVTAYQLPVDPPDLPPPPPQPKTDPAQTTSTAQDLPTYIPTPPTDFTFNPGPSRPIDALPDFSGGQIGPFDLPGTIGPPAKPPAKFDPVGASPRNAPARWVTDSDYRTNWIRKGYSGAASFTLAIEASGRVSQCTITKSSGFAELDEATCQLVERRARFDPAKNGEGKPVAGTYRNTVNWRLPE